MYQSRRDRSSVSECTRTLHIVTHVVYTTSTHAYVRDTCWAQVLNDPGGWSGYAGIVQLDAEDGHWKLVLGTPGVPNSWCWPNQDNITANVDLVSGNCSQESGVSFPGGSLLCLRSAILHGLVLIASLLDKGHDIRSTMAASADVCCVDCFAQSGCVGYTFHSTAKNVNNCWLKNVVSNADKSKCTDCISGTTGPAPPAPNSSDPMPDPATLTCSYSGKVPPSRDGTILFNLASDPLEKSNIAAMNPAVVARLRQLLDVYIASAVEPLNLTPLERKTDPAAKAAAEAANCWVPWSNATVKLNSRP
eukprot:m.51122 g.51122  ORF g.51122 m.51122 type:complete len:305 (-) comp16400_c0_seq1:272-1186(-)